MLDMTSVLKAADAMSRRTLLPKLLESLTAVVTENAGAPRGYLLMEKQGEWAVEAAYTPEGLDEADAARGRIARRAASPVRSQPGGAHPDARADHRCQPDAGIPRRPVAEGTAAKINPLPAAC